MSDSRPIYGRAPYNPYDPTESRPVGGYPSEYAIPGKLSPSGTIRPATEFQRVKHAMNQLHFTPRPASQIYPGQYKILRRVNDNSRFNLGSKYVARGIIVSVCLYSLFFHRWNDGYDHIFSGFYRFQLKCKWFVFGTLSKQDFDDLTPKQKGLSSAMVNELPIDLSANENQFALQRPSRDQIIMAEQVAQGREEKYLKALDIAERQVQEKQKLAAGLVKSVGETEQADQPSGKSKSWFNFF